jgi:Uma2 family endonuclease
MSTRSKSPLTAEQYLEIERRAEFKSEFHTGDMFALSGGTRAHWGARRPANRKATPLQMDVLLNPILLVEVLSPSTEQYDRGTKVKLIAPSLRFANAS